LRKITVNKLLITDGIESAIMLLKTYILVAVLLLKHWQISGSYSVR